VDASGHLVTGYSGTVSFFASGSVQLPWGVGTLANGTGTFQATLFAAGVQTLAVTDGTVTKQDMQSPGFR
jgi:hypothetical protein